MVRISFRWLLCARRDYCETSARNCFRLPSESRIVQMLTDSLACPYRKSQMRRFLLPTLLLVAVQDLSRDAIKHVLAQEQRQPAVNSGKADGVEVGERVPSEDGIVKNLHSLGLIEGRTNIFRSASPVRDLVNESGEPNADAVA